MSSLNTERTETKVNTQSNIQSRIEFIRHHQWKSEWIRTHAVGGKEPGGKRGGPIQQTEKLSRGPSR